MRLERKKDWWLARARREGNSAVGAGLISFQSVPEQPTPTSAKKGRRRVEVLAFNPAPEQLLSSIGPETRIAFGNFLNLMRRSRGYTVRQLASVARLDENVVLGIEDTTRYDLALRSVYHLAQIFGISQSGLVRLAKFIDTNSSFRREVRFSTRSASEKLTPEENSALATFVRISDPELPKVK
jgi:hypothetical protein